jgi:hypothetical protein
MRISVPLRPTAKNEGQALVGNENSLHGAYSSLSLGEQVGDSTLNALMGSKYDSAGDSFQSSPS